MNFSHESAETILDALWRASWQGAVVLTLVWIICRLLTRLPATVRTWLWRLATLKMFIALFWIAPIDLEVLQPKPLQVASTPEAIVDLNISAPSEPASQRWGEAPAEPFHSRPYTPLSPTSDQLALLEPFSPQTIAAQTPSAPDTPALTLSATIVLIWATAVLAFLIRFAIQLTNARRLLRSTAVASNPMLLQMVVELCRDLKIRRTPRLLITSSSTSPFLIGILRPTLVFPRAILNSAAPETLRMMLAHELAHLQRYDLFWLAFHAAAQALFFFHPLVWIARREAALAQEIACDELAIRTTSSPPHRYADMLLQVISRNTTTAKPNLFAATVATNKNSVERRIRTMKFAGTKLSFTLKLLSALALVSSIISLLPVRLVAEKPLPAPAEYQPPRPVNQRLLEQLPALPAPQLRHVLRTVHNDPLLKEHLAKLARLEQEYAAAKHDNFGKDHPEVRKLTSMLAGVNKQIDDRIEEILAGLGIQAAARNPDISELNLQPSPGDDSASASSSPSEAEILQERINQAEANFKSTEQLVEAGRSSREELYERQRSIHELRIEQSRAENDPAAVGKALEEAIADSEEHLKYIQARIEDGRAPQSALANPQSEMLRLKQQLAQINSRNSPKSDSIIDPKAEEERLQKIIDRAKAHLTSIQQSIESGRGGRHLLYEAQQTLYRLEIEKATLQNDPVALRHAIQRAIQDSEDHLKFLAARFGQTENPQPQLVAAHREILRLQRELADIQSSTQEAASSEPTPPIQNPFSLFKLFARTGGVVQHVHAKLGDKVDAGQLLLELDAAEALARHRTLEARLKVVEAAHQIAQAEFKQVEKAHTNPNPFDSNKPNLAKAEAVLLKSAAELEVATRQLEESNVQLQHYHVRSPVSGVVQMIVPIGDWIPEGGGKILAIISHSEPPAQQDSPK